jgi:hypothetical protein
MSEESFEHNEAVEAMRNKINKILCQNKISDVVSVTAWCFLDAFIFAYDCCDTDKRRQSVKYYFDKLYISFNESTNKMDKDRLGGIN